MLSGHPDETFAQYVLSGLLGGFRIGFNYRHHVCTSSNTNMRSALSNPAVVADYLLEEGRAGRLIGPLIKSPAVMPQVGVIPKGSQPGKWRLIVDLHGSSVNDGIDESLCSLSYVSVNDVARKILELGTGSEMAKLDIKSAYRIVPIHPGDRPLLGMEWEGKLYIDTALPFGLRSAPKIFTAVTDALEWIMKKQGIHTVEHYLDDFILLGPPGTNGCQRNLDRALTICVSLGVPLATEKLVGSTTRLTFLGIEIDSLALELRLPTAKLEALRETIWQGKKCCSKRDMLSLIGQLSHACKVVSPGRRFLRRLISLSSTAKNLSRIIRLNADCRAELSWWATFLSQWNGVSLLWDHQKRT